MILKSSIATMLATGLIAPETPRLIFPKPAIIKPENFEFSKHMLAMPLTMGVLPGKVIPAISIINRSQEVTASTLSGTTRTATGVAIGTASATRRVVVALIGYHNSSATITGVSSATIGGIAATVHVSRSNANTISVCTGIISAVVPTGTTADVAVTFNAAPTNLILWAFALANVQSETATFTGSTANTTTTSSMTINAVNWSAGGYLIAVVGSAVSCTYTWTNITAWDSLQLSIGSGTRTFGTADQLKSTAATNQNVFVTYASVNTGRSLCVASFR